MHTRPFLAALVAAGVAWAQSPQPAPPPPAAPAAPAIPSPLIALLDEHVEWIAREVPEQASKGGDDRYNNRLTDWSPAAVTRRLAECQNRLARLDALLAQSGGLSEDQQTDAAILRLDLQQRIAAAPFHPEQLQITAREGIQIQLPQLADSIPLDTPARLRAYAARLDAIPAHVDQVIAQMREGLKAGRTPPRVVMRGADEQCSASVDAAPRASRFFAPFAKLPGDDPLAARAEASIKSGVLPAFKRLAEFLKTEYIPHCRESLAESQSPDGPASYAIKVKAFTTTDLAPDQIHQIGLREVARLRSEMFEVIRRSDFVHTPNLTQDEIFAAFVKDLRSNPRFYYTKPADLLTGYRDIAKRVDAELPRLFATLPRLSYGVREMPAFMAPASPPAYYYPGSPDAGIAGNMVANTHRLDQRPKYDMIALTMHEAAPGHHLQIALAMEAPGHRIRRIADFTAFVEGWALYSERLGLEMEGGTGKGGEGLYKDPYDDFGRLSFEMWRACRLVVDTGIHAKGWTRQQAIDYMLTNTALAAHTIENEVDRYIGWPGQACAYMIGCLRIRELRAHAQESLGAKFDIRTFHDRVLGAGAIPLDALKLRIDRYIAQRQSE